MNKSLAFVILVVVLAVGAAFGIRWLKQIEAPAAPSPSPSPPAVRPAPAKTDEPEEKTAKTGETDAGKTAKEKAPEEDLPTFAGPDPAGGKPLVEWIRVTGEIRVRRAKDGKVEPAASGEAMFQADMATLLPGAEGFLGFRLSMQGRCKLTDAARFVARGKIQGRDCSQVFELRQGRALFTVGRKPGESTFEVRTPLARVMVRGTQFEVSHRTIDPMGPAAGWKTEIRCIEGEVFVKPVNPGEKAVHLGAGTSVTFESKGAAAGGPQVAPEVKF